MKGKGTCDLVPDAAAPFAAAAADQELSAVAWVEVGREERTRYGQFGCVDLGRHTGLYQRD